MKILVVTDNIVSWKEIICDIYVRQRCDMQVRWAKHEKQIITNNDTITFITEINTHSRGRRYDFVILDKQVSKEIFDNIILPSTIGAVLYTHNSNETIKVGGSE